MGMNPRTTHLDGKDLCVGRSHGGFANAGATEWKCPRVGHGAKKASHAPEPDKLWRVMEKSVEMMLDTRVQNRALGYLLQDVLDDAFGEAFANGYQNEDVRAVRDELHALDIQIGQVFRNVERLQRLMKKTMLKP